MTITESKNKSGKLTFETSDTFETQATNVTITPSYEEVGDPVETLSGDQLTASTTRGNLLKITAIQDFTDADGFVAYTWANDLTDVTFSWQPNGTSGPTYSGTVQVKACEVGGDVNTRLTTETEWTCIGEVNMTPAS